MYFLKILFYNNFIDTIDLMILQSCSKELYNYLDPELKNPKVLKDYVSRLELQPFNYSATKLICIIIQELKHPKPYYENINYYKNIYVDKYVNMDVIY